jgi:hypothetical protein
LSVRARLAALGLVATALASCGGGGPDAPAPPAAARPATAADRALVARAQALVDVRPSDLGYRLDVRGAHGDVRGQTSTGRRTITLYVRSGDAPHRIAHDLAHEIGHAYDAVRLTDAQRRAWLRARGARSARWFPDAGTASDYATGAGDFAEVFARCHAASPDFRSRLAPRPVDACGLLPAGARAMR